MKKSKLVLTLILIALMSTSFSGCVDIPKSSEPTSENSTVADETSGNDSVAENTKISASDLKIEVLGCHFDNEITALDEEYVGNLFQEFDGKVYIDLVLKITNNSPRSLTKEDFSGYFMYNDLRYDMISAIDKWTSVAIWELDYSTGFPSDSVGIIHLFNRVEEAAEAEKITVVYTVAGKEFKEAVSPRDTRNALNKKTRVCAGDKIDVNGLYNIEIISCGEKQYLRASDTENSEQYRPTKDKFIDLVLKVKNNTSKDLSEIKGYVIINGEILNLHDNIEIENNTAIDSISSHPLKSGQEELIHLYGSFDENVTVDNSAVRFNIGGNCYYCTIE